jgi:hypothetical protein
LSLRTSLIIVAVMLAASGARAQTAEGFAGERAKVFVRGGVTWLNVLTETGHERAYNVAAGFLLWGDGHAGLRVELRDVIRPGDAVTIRGVTLDLIPTRHWASVNIGAAFR